MSTRSILLTRTWSPLSAEVQNQAPADTAITRTGKRIQVHSSLRKTRRNRSYSKGPEARMNHSLSPATAVKESARASANVSVCWVSWKARSVVASRGRPAVLPVGAANKDNSPGLKLDKRVQNPLRKGQSAN